MLYIRMLFTMAISLYTSRVVLNTLGVNDYGIYNVVGGVVTMFSFLNSSMSSATQRFLSFELGQNNIPKLQKVFSMSVNIHVLIALIIFILAETLGLWFLNNQLNIPEARVEAANWVYQFTILSFMVTVAGVPFNASIIAHERMNIFAYISIADVTLKLLVVFILQWLGFDKLKLYAILVFGVTFLVSFIYWLYCTHNFKNQRYSFHWDHSLFKTLINYAGWNLWGQAASVTLNQGINILLNIFFGPAINAARGIAYQVNGAVNGFVSNFQMAMNPQIVKSYASDDQKYMHSLIFRGSKYSFFLLLIISVPLLIETETILFWWLQVVPEYTVLFCRLILTNALIDCISGPLITSALASGKIKKFQFMVGCLLLVVLPVSYLLLKMGFPPQATLFVSIVVSIIALFTRLWIISPLVNLSIFTFIKSVLLRIIPVSILSILLPLLMEFSIDHVVARFFAVCIASILSTSICIYTVGLRKDEQLFIKEKINQVLLKR